MDRFANYIHLNSEGLAADESFQSYVFRRSVEDISFWESFIALYPEKHNEIVGAVEILNLLSFERNATSQTVKERELNRLLSSIDALERDQTPSDFDTAEETTERGKRVSLRYLFASPWSRVAASSTGILVLLSAAFFVANDVFRNDIVKYETGYGENMTIHLPDSSVVILNGNTRLTLHEAWDGKNVREVWLDGEAFFEVRKKGSTSDARFTVHTPGMDVEVLGTRFNVFNRDDKANVVLNSGQVEVRIPTATDTSRVFLNPDESIEFSRTQHTITKKQVNAEVLTSWRNRILVFENTPLYEIGKMIEYTYGMEVIFDESVDKNESLAGTVPTENLDVLLTVLAKSSSLNITRTKNRIIVEKTDPVSTKH